MTLNNFLSNDPLPWRWFYFRARFDSFLSNLDPTPAQIEDGATSLLGVIRCLNTRYWDVASETANARLSGGWGKRLWVRPPRDIDLVFSLPREIYDRFQGRTGNRQSALLQEVKGVVGGTYSQTDMRGDGQVVIVPFNHVTIEIVPAFSLANGRFLICDTNGGGTYVETDIDAEIRALDWADQQFHGCARPLVRMAKQWQRNCNVPIASFQIERLVLEFLQVARETSVQNHWWDWLLRDLFAYMRTRANGLVTMPGTGKHIFLGEDWLSRAETAHTRAVKACTYEAENENFLAGSTWQLVFGGMIPAIA